MSEKGVKFVIISRIIRCCPSRRSLSDSPHFSSQFKHLAAIFPTSDVFELQRVFSMHRLVSWSSPLSSKFYALGFYLSYHLAVAALAILSIGTVTLSVCIYLFLTNSIPHADLSVDNSLFFLIMPRLFLSNTIFRFHIVLPILHKCDTLSS